MNPYLLTLTFLLMMSLFTSSEIVTFSQGQVEQKLYDQYLSVKQTNEQMRVRGTFEEFRALDSEGGKTKGTEDSEDPDTKWYAPSLNTNHNRPPNNSRINFAVLLDEKKPDLYEITANLLRILYGDHPFFQTIPGAEYRILDTLKAKKEQTDHFTTPDSLSKISMNDPVLQNIYISMLKGSPDYPSLLHYITFDPQLNGNRRRINFMYVSPAILKAVFSDEALVEKLLQMRQHHWSEIDYNEANRKDFTEETWKNRTAFKKLLDNDLSDILSEAHLDYKTYKSIFDISLGHLGTVLFFIDPETEVITRTLYIPKSKD